VALNGAAYWHKVEYMADLRAQIGSVTHCRMLCMGKIGKVRVPRLNQFRQIMSRRGGTMPYSSVRSRLLGLMQMFFKILSKRWGLYLILGALSFLIPHALNVIAGFHNEWFDLIALSSIEYIGVASIAGPFSRRRILGRAAPSVLIFSAINLVLINLYIFQFAAAGSILRQIEFNRGPFWFQIVSPVLFLVFLVAIVYAMPFVGALKLAFLKSSIELLRSTSGLWRNEAATQFLYVGVLLSLLPFSLMLSTHGAPSLFPLLQVNAEATPRLLSGWDLFGYPLTFLSAVIIESQVLGFALNGNK
jgi:hypothetical protein